MTENLRLSTVQFSGAIGDDAILGVSIATTGEAVGHRLLFDQVTLDQLQQLAAAKATGIKSRFTHPDWFHDGLGKYLGRFRNFRVNGDKLVADLLISKTAHSSPAGDIGNYVLDLAREDPAALGVSVVVDLERAWSTPGGDVPVGTGRPADATGKYPVARITQLYAADVVDEPALNPQGLFQATDEQIRQLFTDEEYLNIFEEGEAQEMPEEQEVQDRVTKLEATIEKLSKTIEDGIIQIGNQPPRGQQLSEGPGALSQFQGYFDWLFGAPGAKLPPPELRRADALVPCSHRRRGNARQVQPLPCCVRSCEHHHAQLTWQSMP